MLTAAGVGGRHHARLHSGQAGGAGRARPTRPCCSPASGPRAPRPPRWPVSDRSWGWRGSPGARSTGTPSPASTDTAARTRWSCRSPGRPRIPAGSTISSPRLPVTVTTPLATPPATLTRCWPSRTQPGPLPGSGWHASDPRKAAAVRKLITRWAPLARGREAARSEVVRSVWVARTWVRRAGELTGHGDDLFFLELPEIFGLLRGERALLDQVPGRRAVYEAYRALPPYPALIRGRFDPARWAADPHRRVDYYDERAAPDDDGAGRRYYRVPRRGRGGRGDGAGAARARGRRPAR